MKKIFLYDLERAFLIFLLLINLTKDEIFIIASEENLDRNSIKILKKYKNLNINIISIDFKNLETNLLKRTFYIKNLRKRLKNLILEIENDTAYLYGVSQFPLATEIFYKEKFIEIEDGVKNYTILKEESKKKIIKDKIKKLIKIFLGAGIREGVLGYTSNTREVYLTENLCKKIPEDLEEKCKIINLKELWNKKSKEEQSIILAIFEFNQKILHEINESTIILFTQPLSEDKVITEEEKVELYSKILKKYNNSSIIIKPHPREKTDYSKNFPNYYVMKERYPVEILELVGINIKKAITIFSSAAFGLGKNIEIDFYGTEINDKLLKRFGTQDNIMKRNAFLD